MADRIVTVILELKIPSEVTPTELAAQYKAMGVVSLRVFEGSGKAHELRKFGGQ